MGQSDEFAIAESKFLSSAAVHRQVTHLPVEHGEGDRRVLNQQFEQLIAPAQG